jgi:YgiT-type zinc finger domain-containing protein
MSMQKAHCKRCRGPLEPKKVEHPYWSGSKLVALIKDVPAYACRDCGYHHFEPVVESSMRTIAEDYIKMGTLFPIPSTPYRNAVHY